jgi:hypothetical protein
MPTNMIHNQGHGTFINSNSGTNIYELLSNNSNNNSLLSSLTGTQQTTTVAMPTSTSASIQNSNRSSPFEMSSNGVGLGMNGAPIHYLWNNLHQQNNLPLRINSGPSNHIQTNNNNSGIAMPSNSTVSSIPNLNYFTLAQQLSAQSSSTFQQ